VILIFKYKDREEYFRMELKSGTQQNGFPGFRLHEEVWEITGDMAPTCWINI
jgi:hypothetical protein